MSTFEKVVTDAFDALGDHDHNMRRDRPYSGQPWTDTGIRGSTEIKGITFRDLRDAFMRAIFHASGDLHPHLYDEAMKGEHACICPADLYGWDFNKLDPMAISQNLSCEVERLMGIWPNVPPESDDDPTIRAILGPHP